MVHPPIIGRYRTVKAMINMYVYPRDEYYIYTHTHIYTHTDIPLTECSRVQSVFTLTPYIYLDGYICTGNV